MVFYFLFAVGSIFTYITVKLLKTPIAAKMCDITHAAIDDLMDCKYPYQVATIKKRYERAMVRHSSHKLYNYYINMFEVRHVCAINITQLNLDMETPADEPTTNRTYLQARG